MPSLLDQIVDAARRHHDPFQADHQQPACAVQVADKVVRSVVVGARPLRWYV